MNVGTLDLAAVGGLLGLAGWLSGRTGSTTVAKCNQAKIINRVNRKCNFKKSTRPLFGGLELSYGGDRDMTKHCIFDLYRQVLFF